MFRSTLSARIIFYCLVVLRASHSFAQTTQPVSINIATGTRFQTIQGLGTGLSSDSPVWNSKYLQTYTQDLGASALRIALTPNILPNQVTLGPAVQNNTALFNFLGNYPQTNWGQFAAQAVSATGGQMKLLGSVWTPPAWMKTNNSLGNGGSLIQTQANLTQFARYMAAYVKGFQQAYGVPLYAVSIQNEPRFAEPYASCVYSDSQYVAAINAVGAEFARDGITTKIMAPEDVGVDGGWITQQQMGYLNALKADPTAGNYVNFYAIHGYSGDGPLASGESYWADYYNQIAADGKQNWMTEESGENPAWIHSTTNGRPDGALAVALNMHSALAYANVNAYVYFQMDNGDTASAVASTLTGSLDTTSLKYNAAKHYMKFIRPGAVRVAASPDNPTGISVDAFVEPDNSLTIELINTSTYDTPTTIAVPGTTYSSFAQYLTTATQPWSVLSSLTVTNHSLSLTIPADSIVTLQSTAGSASLPVPEPAVIALLLPVGLLMLRRRR
jgi:O-glycosyl hydrolase